MEAALFVPSGTMSNLIAGWICAFIINVLDDFSWGYNGDYVHVIYDAVMVHCRERGDEMIVGDLSHIHIYEQGGSAQVEWKWASNPFLQASFIDITRVFFSVLTQLAGVHATTVTNLPDGTFDIEQLESKIRHGYPDPHYPRSRLICVENTHNIQGGRVLPLQFLKEVPVEIIFLDKSIYERLCYVSTSLMLMWYLPN